MAATREGTARGSAGRARLLDTAERMLDEHGIDGVSLRTLTAASGHRNASAVNYYFGDREQLILAVLDRRRLVADARRDALLDALEARGEVHPRDAIEAMLLPLVELLDDPSGRRYIRLLFQVSVHPAYYDRQVTDYAPSIARTLAYILPAVAHLPLDRQFPRLRIGLGMALLSLTEQSRLLDAETPVRPPLEREAFTVELVDVIHGCLRA